MTLRLAGDVRQKAAALWSLHRIKRMVREIGGLAPHTLVMVTEIPCADPACPGPATRITILGLDLMRRVIVIHRPLSEVSAADLQAVLG